MKVELPVILSLEAPTEEEGKQQLLQFLAYVGMDFFRGYGAFTWELPSKEDAGRA